MTKIRRIMMVVTCMIGGLLLTTAVTLAQNETTASSSVGDNTEEVMQEEAVTQLEGVAATTTDEDDESETITIVTGDAAAEAVVDTIANTTVVMIESTSTPATSTQPEIVVITVAGTSTAVVDNTASTSAGTGGNNAVTEETNVEVVTGDSFAYARIFNQVNSHFVNTSGAAMFFNNLFSSIGNIDLRNLPPFYSSPEDRSTSTTTDGCGGCGDVETTVAASSSADITNTAIVRSVTGDNAAVGGDTRITTGDSFAAADVINVANTSVVDGGYLLLSFQNFGDWFGDLVFPNEDVLAQFFSQVINSAVTDNNASIHNEITARADTGGNITEGASSSVATGEASSHSTVVNQANTTLINTDQFAVAIRVHGDWVGEIFNAPDNLVWGEDGSGLLLFSLDSSGVISSLGSDNVSISGSSNAQIGNNLQVIALTGDNQAVGDGSADITTGNAYAGANIINVVNTNVIGRNMLLAVLNIFGDWEGNVSFGQPDLWVGGVVDTSESERLRPGSSAEFSFDVANRGDADAHDVVLDLAIDDPMFFISATASSTPESSLTVELGDIPAGEQVQVQVTAMVVRDLADHNQQVTSLAIASQHETDANENDNQEEIVLLVNQSSTQSANGAPMTRRSVSRTGRQDSGTDELILSVMKTQGELRLTATSTQIDYTVVARNESSSELTDGVVIDEITDSGGELLHVETWDLGTVFPGEEITVSYTSVLPSDVAGRVGNAAQMQAYTTTGEHLISNVATTSSMIGAVLGVQDVLPAVCTPYLSTYLRPGSTNNTAAVEKLQQFLIAHEEVSYVHVTGEFDLMTDIAVRRFQEKYAADVLAPWGLTEATGYVYETTLAKINNIACDGKITIEQLERLQQGLESLQVIVRRWPEERSAEMVTAEN